MFIFIVETNATDILFFLTISDEFSKSHKPRRKDLSNGDIDEHEKRSKRVSSLNSSTHKSSDNKLEEVWSFFCFAFDIILEIEFDFCRLIRIDSIIFPA